VLETFVREGDEIPPASGKMMTPRGPQASLLLADPPITIATFYPTVIVQRKVRPCTLENDCRLAYSHIDSFPVPVCFFLSVHPALRRNGILLSQYSRTPFIWMLVIRLADYQIGLALRVNLSRILQN
jgi:hypothetical protein